MKTYQKAITLSIFLTVCFILGVISFHLIEYSYWLKDKGRVAQAAASAGMPQFAGNIINVQECVSPLGIVGCPNCPLSMTAVGNACIGFTEIDFNPQINSRAPFISVVKGYQYYGGRTPGNYPFIGGQVISTGPSEGVQYIVAVSSLAQNRVEKAKNFVTDYIIAGFKGE